MRRTLLISALTAIVVMAIVVFAAPRLGTAIAGPDSQEEIAIDDEESDFDGDEFFETGA